MAETFIELVPKSATSLRETMAELEASGLPFDGYNIPELLRSGQQFLTPEELMQLRFDGSISEEKQLTLHLRTRERSVQQTVDRLRLATGCGVNIALLVTGDSNGGQDQACTYAHEVLPMIEQTPLNVAVAADLYRPNWGRWGEKIAGIQIGTVDAVFTQPIFDHSLFGEISKRTEGLLPREKIYAGITWMTTERSRTYWHERNGVPMDHLIKGDSDEEIRRNSISQAADMLRAARREGYSSYIMPIRGTRQELERILSMAENIR